MKAHGIEAPDCVVAPRSRDNHNGNGPNGFANTYNWTLPEDINDNCALRLRYNISTGEFQRNITSALSKYPKVTISSNSRVYEVNRLFPETFCCGSFKQ